MVFWAGTEATNSIMYIMITFPVHLEYVFIIYGGIRECVVVFFCAPVLVWFVALLRISQEIL